MQGQHNHTTMHREAGLQGGVRWRGDDGNSGRTYPSLSLSTEPLRLALLPCIKSTVPSLLTAATKSPAPLNPSKVIPVSLGTLVGISPVSHKRWSRTETRGAAQHKYLVQIQTVHMHSGISDHSEHETHSHVRENPHKPVPQA